MVDFTNKKTAYIIYESDDVPYESSYLVCIALTKNKAEETIRHLQKKNDEAYKKSEKLREDYYKFEDYMLDNNLDFNYDETNNYEHDNNIYKKIAKAFNISYDYVKNVYESDFYINKNYYYVETPLIE